MQSSSLLAEVEPVNRAPIGSADDAAAALKAADPADPDNARPASEAAASQTTDNPGGAETSPGAQSDDGKPKKRGWFDPSKAKPKTAADEKPVTKSEFEKLKKEELLTLLVDARRQNTRLENEKLDLARQATISGVQRAQLVDEAAQDLVEGGIEVVSNLAGLFISPVVEFTEPERKRLAPLWTRYLKTQVTTEQLEKSPLGAAVVGTLAIVIDKVADYKLEKKANALDAQEG